ncbi:MAG: hypothetical protein JW734_03085 [Candidatus Omnitrophica bacterium]|nr:hypothetical protein [Candidatus Omnitrophota bacterium]
MKYLVFGFLFIFVFYSRGFSAEEGRIERALNEVLELQAPEYEWIQTLSPGAASIVVALGEIDENTPEATVKIKIEEILAKMQKMRKELKSYGITIESFSLNIGFPPSLTINCKFED